MIDQTDTEQADPVLKTTGATTEPDTRHEAAAPLGKPAAAIQPALAAGVEPLVRARQALGLGASDIAAKLGMATRQIEALERGDWQTLPGQAFVRGALRSYGKSVGVDVAPLLAAIGGQVAAPELRSSASLDATMPHRGTLGFGGSSGSGGRLIWIVLGVAAVIAMALYFGDAFEIGRSTGGEESVAAGGVGASSAVGTAAGGTGSPSTPASGLASPGTGSTNAGASGASNSGATSGRGAAAPGAAAPGAAAPGAAAPGAASGAVTGRGAGDATPSGSGFSQLAPLVPLAPAPSAQAVDSGAAAGASAAASGSAAAGASGAAGANGAAGAGNAAAAGTAAESGAGGTAAASGAGVRGADGAGSGDAGASSATSGSTVAATGGDRLRLQFARESWVDIRDGAGKVLLQGTQAAGSSREVSGAAPFKLVIGNAQHVNLERNGRNVELGNRMRSGVARLTLE